MTEILFADLAGFEAWLRSLEPESRFLTRATVSHVLRNHNTVPSTKLWIKPVSKEVLQLRIGPTYGHVMKLLEFMDYEHLAKEKLLVRVFAARIGSESFVVLSGYDKKSDLSRSRQKVEIELAINKFEAWTNRIEVF